MRKLDNFLSGAIPGSEVLKRARAQIILRDWPKFVGEFLATKSYPERYDHGTVWISVEGSAWAQELRMQKSEILNRLAEDGGEVGLFTDLRFGVRKMPLPAEPQSSKVEEPAKVRTEESIREIAERRLAQWNKPHR